MTTDIEDFNRLYGLPVMPYPRMPFPGLSGAQVKVALAHRLLELHKILQDEVSESLDIVRDLTDPHSTKDPLDTLTDLADWLVDITVFCRSELAKFGINYEDVLGIVMASNMSKLGEGGKPIIRDGKVQKGPNYWKPEPMIRNYLNAAIRQGRKEANPDKD